MGQGFDVQAARNAGYSDDDIIGYLTTSRKFDVQGALKSGYSKGDIINHLAGSSSPQAKPAEPDSTRFFPPGTTYGTIGPDKSSYLDKVEMDLKNGEDSTIVGKVFKALGAPGLYKGTTPETAEKIASPILGPLHAAQGISQIPSKPLSGTLKTLSGAAQTLDIPLAFLGSGPGNAESVMGKVIPSVAKEQAASKFADVMSAAKNNPVQVTNELSNALSRYQELVDAGGSRSLAVSKLLKRVTDPEQGPMSYKEARDFYSNLTKLSADEMNRLTPVMRAQVAKVTQELGSTIGETATAAGKGDTLAQALKQYRYGAQGDKAVKSALKYGIGVGGGAVGADLLARYLINRMR